MTIGIQGMGFCGWVISIQAISKSVGPGIISMIASVAFRLQKKKSKIVFFFDNSN